MTIIPASDSALITTAQDMITRLETRLVAVEKLITPNAVSQADLMYVQVDYPYWRNSVLTVFSDTSATPNYGAPFRRLTFDVQAICHIGNTTADHIEDRARLIVLTGALQFQRRSYLQSPTYPDGYAEIDPNSFDNGIFRSATLSTSDETGGTVYTAVFRLALPVIYESQDLSEV